MSTQNEVNGAYPYYVNYYLHQNNVAIGDLGSFSLSYENNQYTIVSWGYPSITEPVIADLEAYTLSDVMNFNQATQDHYQLSSATVPMILDETRETAVGDIGDLPLGSLVWNSTNSSLHAWDGTQWKTIAFQQ